MNELFAYRDSLQQQLKGLGIVSWLGWANPLNLLLRRRESYLLGELRGCLIAIDLLEKKGKL